MSGPTLLVTFIVLFILVGLLLVNGKMLSLINVPPAKREKYDERRLGKFVGFFMFGYAVAFMLILVAEECHAIWSGICGTILLVALSVFLIVSVIAGNRFVNKKKDNNSK